jgi:hypothetical protein
MIDAVLEPFSRDETQLMGRLDEIQQHLTALTREAAEMENDLQVVRAARVDALRQAAAQNPLLQAAFLGSVAAAAEGTTLEEAGANLELVSDPKGDSHPLLAPTG